MAEEKSFIINLRREFIKKPRYQRSKKAITAIKEYANKHLKTKETRIGPNLNLKIWEHGRKNPPPKIKVKAIVEDNISYVELPGFEFSKPKPKEEKKEKTMLDKLTSKKEEVKETPKEEIKKEQEKELNKELAKERQIEDKKEHKKDSAEVKKTQEKIIEKVKDEGQKIGRTGKKGSKSA